MYVKGLACGQFEGLLTNIDWKMQLYIYIASHQDPPTTKEVLAV